ncbi:uncharacterized protein PF3D7_1120000-like [Polyergus mexicanus]|uniref:uncharacterized protein PF3D7_1120000-like n=1 Tax=Polyergus mexicanus TaxID=615972 RepID=UPI0038B5E6ED
MDDEYGEYRCSACKKTIKNQVVTCKSCYQMNPIKLFYHPGCVSKHRIYDKNQELVLCSGPFDRFSIESEADMKKTSAVAGGGRDRLGSTGSTGSFTTPSNGNRISGASGSSTIDVKIDWLIKVVKEIKDETACKKEIKMMVKEIVREELGNVKQELLEELKRMIQGEGSGSTGGIQRSYSEAVKEKKKENVIIIKPKIQQESEVTKKLIKEKVDIKNMAMGITKLKKGSKGTVIMGCETGEKMKTLKATVQDKLGENFKVTESPQMKPKIKIINVSEEEMRLDDDDLITTIKKQNRIDAINDGFQMRIVKKIVKEKRNDNNQLRRKEKEEVENKLEKNQDMNISVRAKKFVDSFINALDATAPRKNFRIPRIWEGKKWFSDEIREAAAKRDEAYRKVLYDDTEQNWLQFKIERNTVVKLIKTKKKEYYENMIDLNKENPTSMWKTLNEIIRGEPGGKREVENIDFEILDSTEGCNIADKFNLYYIQSINSIVKSINGSKTGNACKRIIYVIENEGIMENFEMISREHLQEIVMGLPKKEGTEEGITSDILKAAFCVIKEEFVDIINNSLKEGCCPKG